MLEILAHFGSHTVQSGLVATLYNRPLQVRARSTFTNLLMLPALLQSRLPLPPHAVRGGAGEPLELQSTAAADVVPGILEGLKLHIESSTKLAMISILYL